MKNLTVLKQKQHVAIRTEIIIRHLPVYGNQGVNQLFLNACKTNINDTWKLEEV